MKRLLLIALLAAGCDDVTEPVDVGDNVLVVVEPSPKPGIWVSCELLPDGTSCKCAQSECSAAAITEAVKACNKLRYPPKPIVVE